MDMHRRLKGLISGTFRPLTLELLGPGLENYYKNFDDFTCWLAGERSLPFGLLVSFYIYYFFSHLIELEIMFISQ